MTIWNPVIWHVSYFSEAPSGDQIQFPNGSAANPGFVFRGSGSTGLYYTATQVNVSVSGTLRLAISSTGIAVSGDVNAVKGIFSGDVSGVKGTFSSDVSGVKGIFSGDVSGVLGNFSGNIQQGGVTVVDTNKLVITPAKTVGTLPATPADGARSFVTDSNQTLTAGIGTPVATGGTNHVPVYYDGGAAAWLIG